MQQSLTVTQPNLPLTEMAGILSIHAFVHSRHFSIADNIPGHGSEVLKRTFFFSFVLSDTEVKLSISAVRTSGDALPFISYVFVSSTHRRMSSQVYASRRSSLAGVFDLLSWVGVIYIPRLMMCGSPCVKCEFSLSHLTQRPLSSVSCNSTCGLRDKG